MNSFDKLRDTIMQMTEETTLEEARNINASAIETIGELDTDITAMASEIDRLKTENETKDGEIDRLKTENGKLYRERVSSIVETKEADEVEKELTRDELEAMFRATE